MHDLELIPLSSAERELVAALMGEEEEAWKRELDWDYGPVRRILRSLLDQRLLPGYMAGDLQRGLGYTYFLIHQHKAIIGTFFGSRSKCTPEIADAILSAAIRSIQAMRAIKRIEAQIMPFNGIDPRPVFGRHAFRHHPRYYMEMRLSDRESRATPLPVGICIAPWDLSHAALCAEIVLRSYSHETDSLICEDYCSLPGCESYLHSLVENPGCGIFLDRASFMALGPQGAPCGLIIGSKISSTSAMIPQISILPEYQGKGLGNALIRRSLEEFARMGFPFVTLAVTQDNQRALEWYQRLGFKVRKEFGAYVWRRIQ